MAVLAFDVYGTLIDPLGIESKLRESFGDRAREACELWRQKQLEYSFRRAIMQRYESFPACTAQALEFVARKFDVTISDSQRRGMLDHYRKLPPYPDVVSGLNSLRSHRLVAFSNGIEDDVRTLLDQAGILSRFQMIVSVDDVKTFKPSRVVYDYLADRCDADKHEIWMVSSNPFDVIGAKSAGLRAAWLRREPRTPFDPWEYSPDAIVASIADMESAVL